MDFFRKKSINNNNISKSPNKFENKNITNSTTNNISTNSNDMIKPRTSVDITSKYQFFEVGSEEVEVEKNMSYILSKIEDVEKKENKKFLMEKYSDLEIELLKHLKNTDLNVNQKKFLKIFIYENLHSQFLEKNCDERRKIESKISDVCLECLKKLDEIKDFKNHFNVNFSYSNLHIEKNNNKEITEILKAMENSLFSEMKFSICSKLNICSIPNFFIKNFKKNLKQKIRKFWKLNYEIPIINLLLESKFGFKFLKVKFRDLIDERLNIFDSRYFPKVLREILFKFFVVINLDTMKKNKHNLQTFLNNFKKYVYLMGLHDDYDTLINLVVDLTHFEAIDYNEKQKLLIDSISEKFLKIFFPIIKLNKENSNLVFGLPSGVKEQSIRKEDMLNLNMNFHIDFLENHDNNFNDFDLNKKEIDNFNLIDINENNQQKKFKQDLMNVFVSDSFNQNNPQDKLNNNNHNTDLFINNGNNTRNNETGDSSKKYVNINKQINNEKNQILFNLDTNNENTKDIDNNFNIFDFFAPQSDPMHNMSPTTTSIFFKNEIVKEDFEITDETRLLIVFSFSIMLNNLMTTCLVEDNQPVEDGEITNIKILFTPNLKCSARERNFLVNILFALEFYSNLDLKLRKIKKAKNLELGKQNSFNLFQSESNMEITKDDDDLKFSYLEINYMMENSILIELVKSYSKVLFDELNKQKLVLDNEKIFDIFYNFNENDAIINDYEIFYKTNIENVSEKTAVNKITSKLKNFYSNISSKFKRSSLPVNSGNEKKIKLEMNFLKFIPLDPISISPHLCLCISGGFVQDTHKENFWLNFGLDDKIMDYYYMNWQEDYYKASFFGTFLDTFNLQSFDSKLQEYRNVFRKNKRTSKGYGRLLAYLIASRSIFKFQTVSFMAYGVGANLLKYTLLELNKLSENYPEISELIGNVIFIGGATNISNKEKYSNLFDIVGGKIINIFSSFDTSLKMIYNPNCIGLKALDIYNADNNSIHNIDLSYLKINHKDYKNELGKIIEKINLN